MTIRGNGNVPIRNKCGGRGGVFGLCVSGRKESASHAKPLSVNKLTLIYYGDAVSTILLFTAIAI